MQRLVIFGAPGSGKSTLAQRLGARLALPVVYLDALFYEPGWQPGDGAQFRKRLREAHAGTRWVSEGNFIAASADLRLPLADTILFIGQPRWLSCLRAALRGLRAEAGRADQAAGCRNSIEWNLLKYIWRFDTIEKPVIDAAMERLAPHARVMRLEGDRAVEAFLEGLPNERDTRR